MLENFWFHVKIGIDHVLDLNGYDHLLFLVLLAVPYTFNHWKRILLLVSLFTLGHTLSLILGTYNVVSVNGSLVELLIKITIGIAALYNILTAGKKYKHNKINLIAIAALFFGLIHGLGFAREFKMIVGQSKNKLELLIEFALGIEIAQIIIVFSVLFLGFLADIVFRISKRDWVMLTSAIVLGLLLSLIF